MHIQLFLLLSMAFLLPTGAQGGEIIGGHEAQPHSRPYMAFLRIQHGDKRSNCGGFLVSKNVVLTAAHCQGQNITVYLGAHNVKQREWSQQRIAVRRQIPHPDYNKKAIKNDIMLLQLSRNASLTGEVGLIRLTSGRHRMNLSTTCSVAGWGKTSLPDRTDRLREVELKVMPDAICENRYLNYDASSMLCAGDPNVHKSIYKGDSGGPLVCHGVAEGIVSKSKRKSIKPPAVYTRISHFLSWIMETMKEM
ncbi:cathepsin G-like [Carettochelys insculpta]|uniref:cathepsin G-like n=1 Tax=Carettochelys insculpta TaxID=44489 RepID=UPI003EBCCB9F